LPPDDPGIPDAEGLLRRVIADWVDPRDGTLIASAFLDRRSGFVSVNRASMTTRDKVLKDYNHTGIAELKAAFPRFIRHAVASDPQPDDPSHALIVPPGDLDTMSKRKAAARQMAKAARMVVPIPD
jgi:hypothetical protein